MKSILSLLIKVGILAAIVFACVASNPKEKQHLQAINAKQAALQEKDVLGQTDRLMYQGDETEEERPPYTYHNYFVCSKVTGPEKDMLSFGLFKRVFVTKSEL